MRETRRFSPISYSFEPILYVLIFHRSIWEWWKRKKERPFFTDQMVKIIIFACRLVHFFFLYFFIIIVDKQQHFTVRNSDIVYDFEL